MAKASVKSFADPEQYQAAIRPSQVELLVTAKGSFDAALRRVEFSTLWMQRGRENLPRIANSTASADRPPIFFLTGEDQAPVSHSGRDFVHGEIAVAGRRSTHHHRSEGPCQWGTVSITGEHLAAAAAAVLGHDVTSRSTTQYFRPAPAAFSRLLNIHEAAGQLGKDGAVIAGPTARALEQGLLHALIACFSKTVPVQMGSGTLRHTGVISRFEEALAASYDQPLYLAEICSAIGASERTLRISCMEHLGMGPVRYLWLRRMHLAHRALLGTSPGTATVTDIATANGFWEFGRFAVEYQALFGEPPSASLRRPAQEIPHPKTGRLPFADSEYA